MGERTGVSWCHHTHNEWIGCTKKSAGCAHCYAERDTPARVLRSKGIETWGPKGVRHLTSEANRKKPLNWNRKARIAGVRRRVFCASQSDVFEERPELAAWRIGLFKTIAQCPDLDWLLLTKRPENVMPHLNAVAGTIGLTAAQFLSAYPNIWIGTTVENQEMADERIPILVDIPAKTKFLSVEPMLGQVDIYHKTGYTKLFERFGYNPISWVICGGESGVGARRMKQRWANDLRVDCRLTGVPFFFKQHGDNSDAGDPTLHHGGDYLEGKQYHEVPYEN